MPAPYLHLIQYDAEPAHEDAYDRWYNHHILNVLQQPGYTWSSRYVSLKLGSPDTEIRNLTMHIVTEAKGFDVVLNQNEQSRPKALTEDQATFAKLPGVRYVHSGIFEQVAGSNLGKPLLQGNNCVLITLTDVTPGKGQEWCRWIAEEEFPVALEDPRVLMTGLFRAVEGFIPSWLVQCPRYLAIYELAGEEAARSLTDPKQMNPAIKRLVASPGFKPAIAMRQRQLRLFYKPISQHWSYWKAAESH